MLEMVLLFTLVMLVMVLTARLLAEEPSRPIRSPDLLATDADDFRVIVKRVRQTAEWSDDD